MITSTFNIFKSSLTLENRFQKLSNFLNNYDTVKEKNNFVIDQIPFNKLNKWNFQNGYLCHDSGKFFKIEGIKVNTNFGNISEWEQPIINQAEIGILGIITKVFGKTRYFLTQLKMEPGNINLLQLSPSVQATKSNFSQVHQGKSVLFLEYFIDRKKSKILIDQLQSEQGGRFLRKRNRNMIVEIYDDIEIPENFFWLTLSEIKTLLKIDNFVNMDLRSVLSTIPLESNFDFPYYSNQEIIRWYIDQKVKYELEINKISLDKLNNWVIDDYKIYNKIHEDRFFSVIAVNIESGNREVSSWTQPLIKDLNMGLIGLISKKINNDYYFLFQTKVMPGNIDTIDLSPTISISNYKYVLEQKEKPLFLDKFINNKNSKILYDIKQSEEGGRFYHLQTVNKIIEITEEIDVLDNFIWLSKDQINNFMPYGMFNIESRSLISLL